MTAGPVGWAGRAGGAFSRAASARSRAAWPPSARGGECGRRGWWLPPAGAGEAEAFAVNGIDRTDKVRVVLPMPDQYVPYLNRGDKATLQIVALRGQTFKVEVSRFSLSEDQESRNMRTEVDLPNPDGKLHPGLYAYASIVAEEHPDALTIPVTAIGRDGDNPTIWESWRR